MPSGSLVVVTGVVVGGFCWWSLWGGVAPRHTAIDHEVSAVDEAGLVAGEEENRLSLFNGFSKTTGGEVNLAAVALGLIITKPVLEKRSATKVSDVSLSSFDEHTSKVLGKAR